MEQAYVHSHTKLSLLASYLFLHALDTRPSLVHIEIYTQCEILLRLPLEITNNPCAHESVLGVKDGHADG